MRAWRTLLLVATAGSTAGAAAPPAGKGAHGATAMGEQEAQLDKLASPPGKLPAAIDPVTWASTIPADNATTPERIALGRKLYFDTRLSADGTVSCATCHDVTRGFTDQRPLAEGIGDKLGRRNSPTTMNAALLHSQFWDGRAATLEAQAVLPIVNPIEMGHPDGAAAVKAIAGDPAYVQMFQAAYGRAPGYEDIGRALAAFERTLIFLDAPFDRFLRGDGKALSAEAQRGWVLFNGKARCVTCHPVNVTNPLGTDNRFHNIGVSARHQDFGALAARAIAILEKNNSVEEIDRLALETDMSELGRFLVTKNYADIGGFRTSQLRNIGVTGPYMHDGSLQTLWDVMDHYNKGGEPNAFLDGGIEPLALTEAEINDVVAFLFALTDVRLASQSDGFLAAQREAAGKNRPFRDDQVAQRKKVTFKGSAVSAPAGK